MKFAYVIEDGEIIKKEATPFNVNELSNKYFGCGIEEREIEKNGVLHVVSDVEMIMETDLDVSNVEELWQ